METFYSNYLLSPLYTQWLAENGIAKSYDSKNAEWLFLKTQGLLKTLKFGHFAKAKNIFGFAYSYQLAAKNMFWFNLKRHNGAVESLKITPFTINLEEKNAHEQLRTLLQKGEKIILKNNKQKRQGLLILNNESELNNAQLQHYLIAQKIIENGLKIEQRRFNIRLYLSVVAKNKQVDFELHSIGKIIYTENDKDFITDKKYYNPNLPLLTNNISFAKYLPPNWFEKCRLTVEKALLAHEFYFLKNLKPNITYFDLFGIDILFTDKLEPLILEFNRMPNMQSDFKEDIQLKKNVLWNLLIQVSKKS